MYVIVSELSEVHHDRHAESRETNRSEHNGMVREFVKCVKWCAVSCDPPSIEVAMYR